MNETRLREQIHQAVNAYGAHLPHDPCLAQRIIAQTERKEVPRMKKLSTGAIIAIALMLASLTALAVGLSIEDLWHQSFEKMNTSGEIRTISDEAEAEFPLEEAIAIARDAIFKKFGTPAEELDAMGVYPTYLARGWDGQTDDYPSEWEVFFSSRTDVDLDYDHVDYGPTGEYLVQMNAETKEVFTCIWYTNDFWSRARTVWDCGSHDEVYWHYQKPEFYTLSAEEQTYWTNLLAENGFEVVTEEEKLHKLLKAASTDLQFCDLNRIADNTLPQVDAAWAALETARGLDAELLRKYCYVATLPDWDTGTDNVCIHFSFEKEWDMMECGFLHPQSDMLFTYANALGLYMVSFEPGTTNVTAITHVTHSESTGLEAVTEGELLARTNWTAPDLILFNDAFDRLNLAVQRMEAAGMTAEDIRVVVRDDLYNLGGLYTEPAPENIDTAQWFVETSPLDASIADFAQGYADYATFTAAYGHDSRFWPLEVLVALYPDEYRMPREGTDELTVAQAIDRALQQVVLEKGQSALDDLGDYVVGCRRVSLTNDPNKPDCRWEIYITDDPSTARKGWKITFGEWADHIDKPSIQLITDMSNG